MSSCKKSDEELLQDYLTSINAGQDPGGMPSALQLPSSGAGRITTVGGVATRADGFCGDGIVNVGEHCDGRNSGHTLCSEIGGSYGNIKCTNECHMDISDCLTPKIDTLIGGLTEVCDCNCEADSCSGGCNPSKFEGASVCSFECDNDCICNCEGKIEAHIEECDVNCACDLDENGDPDCDCSLDTCRVLTVINPNIRSLVIGDLQR